MYLDHSYWLQLFKLLLVIVTLANAVSETGEICVEDETKVLLKVGITKENYLALSFYKLDDKTKRNVDKNRSCEITIPVQLKIHWKDETQSILKSSLSIENSFVEPKIFLFGGLSFENIKWLLVSVESPAESDIAVFYENPLSQMISKQLQENHSEFSAEERKYILKNYGDATDRIYRNENYSEDLADALRGLLDLTLYIGNESNLGVLESLEKSIFQRSKILLQGNDRARRIFQAYFNPKIQSMLERHGDIEKVLATEESNVVVKWCLYLEISSCLKYATYFMLEWEDSGLGSEKIIFPQSNHVTALNWKCATITNEVTESINFPLWKYLRSQLRCHIETTSCIYDHVGWENLQALLCTKNRDRFRESLELTSNSTQFPYLLATTMFSPLQYLEEFKILMINDFTMESLVRGNLKPFQFALIIGKIINMNTNNSWGGEVQVQRRKQLLQELNIFVRDNEKIIGSKLVSVILAQIDTTFQSFSLNNKKSTDKNKIFVDVMLDWMVEDVEY